MPYQSHTTRIRIETRMLQATVGVLAVVPVAAGLAGIVQGPRFLGAEAPWPADLDSHFRFLSGTFLALGLAWYSCIPDIARKTGRFRLLALLTFAGGLARLVSLGLAGALSAGHLYGLGAELVVVPVLVLWQARIAAARTGAEPARGLYWV
jgi:hypothetical protein